MLVSQCWCWLRWVATQTSGSAPGREGRGGGVPGGGGGRGVTQRGEDSTITAMSTYTGSHNTHISDREAEPKKKEKMVACEML